MQSDVTQPPRTSRMLSRIVRPGSAPDQSPTPPMITAPNGFEPARYGPQFFQSATGVIPRQEHYGREHVRGLDRGRPDFCREPLREFEHVPGGVGEGDLLTDLLQRPALGGVSADRLWRDG